MFPDLMTTAQDGGKVVSLTHRPTLPPGNETSRGTQIKNKNTIIKNRIFNVEVHHNKPQMAQPGTQPMGNQCQYILSSNASNTDNGNLQPDNNYTSLVYVSNNVNCYYYTYQQFLMHQ